ncbi:MAG: ABC transporter permease [Fusobacteriia bacterium 4572_74]|nr:MAG: ABC transporter permease [Fusobacteriia bacterium 4572_74]
MKKSRILNIGYLILWIFPIYIFGRDFFHLEDLIDIMDGETLGLITMSFKQGILSSILAFIAAILPAYYVTYRRGFLSTLIEGTIFIPFFFPVISTVITFSLVFNLPLLKDLGILYSLKAILIANIFYNAPIFVKYLSLGMKRIPNEVIEAGLECGASKWIIFAKIKLPLILPQIFRGFFLVFTYSFTSFGIVLSLGGLKFSTLEVEIVNSLMGSADFSRMFALGIVQFIILTGVNILGENIVGYELEENEKNGEVSFVTKIYSYLFILFELGIVGINLVFSFYNYYDKSFSARAFIDILSPKFNQKYPVIESIINSGLIAMVTAFIVVIFTYLLLKSTNKFSTYIIFSTFGISSGFLGITLVYTNIIYDIPYIILLIGGFFLTTVPLAYSFMYQYIKKFPIDILEASSIDGANKFQTLIYVELPILKEVLTDTYLQIFAVIYAEFTITYTMQLGRYLPLSSVVNYNLYINKLFLESAAMSSLNIVIIGILFMVPYMRRKKI